MWFEYPRNHDSAQFRGSVRGVELVSGSHGSAEGSLHRADHQRVLREGVCGAEQVSLAADPVAKVEPLRQGAERKLLKAARRYARMKCFRAEVDENGCPVVDGKAYGHIVHVGLADADRTTKFLLEGLEAAAVDYLLAMTVDEIENGLVE